MAAKGFQTPTKSVNGGRWDRFPLRERVSPEPVSKAKTPKAKTPGRSVLDLNFCLWISHFAMHGRHSCVVYFQPSHDTEEAFGSGA
jgi:hypothetical protein